MKLKAFLGKTLLALSLVYANETVAKDDFDKKKLELIDIDPSVYANISDITNPTISDLRYLQYHLKNDKRPLIKYLKDKEFIPRELKIIGDKPNEMPESGHYAVNISEDERENCIIIYSTFNQWYPRGVKRLVDSVVKSDFKGHIYWKIGGWPNIEGGDLVLAHVPFAFKVCFFKEVQKLGFKRVLWVDASILPSPYHSLNEIFDMIEDDGYFVQGNFHNVGPFCNEEAANAFGLTLAQTDNILSVSAAILGIDFTNPIGSQVIDLWYQAAKHPRAFYSARSDQNALSLVFYNLGASNFKSMNTLGDLRNSQPHHLFLMDRGYVKYKHYN